MPSSNQSQTPSESTERSSRELIVGIFYDKDRKRHEYAYTAVGFAPDNVIERANAREAACRQRR